MLIKKIYLKTRVFLYSKRKIINKITVYAMIFILLYLLLNSFILTKVIINLANQDKANQKYNNALFLYNIAYSYYGLNHFSDENKKIYLKLPYEISFCEYKNNRKKESEEILSKASSRIQKQYGYYSKENAKFKRKFLIKYYLLTNNPKAAKGELFSLFGIYQKVDFDQNVRADLLRIAGDTFFQQKDPLRAIFFYEKAYSIISKQQKIDYEIYTNIINRICEYEIKEKRTDNAIQTYKNTLTFLQKTNNINNESIPVIMINLAALYSKREETTKEAIQYYEEAIKQIEKLPKSSSLKPNLYEYYSDLKSLYIKNNQPHKASKIDVELARRRRFAFLY